MQCSRSLEAFGAIAYGAQSRASGFSYDAGDVDAASDIAMSNGKKHGNDCELVPSFPDSCGAVAAISNSQRFGIGQGTTRDQAQFNALASYKKNDSGDREVQVRSCTLP